jgi:hypothetical protein
MSFKCIAIERGTCLVGWLGHLLLIGNSGLLISTQFNLAARITGTKKEPHPLLDGVPIYQTKTPKRLGKRSTYDAKVR